MNAQEFLILIKEAVVGDKETNKKLQETQEAAKRLTQTQITTTFDKEGLEKGRKIAQTFKETISDSEEAAQKLTQTKITTTFDKEGLEKGRKIAQTFKEIKPAADGASKKMGDFEKALRRVIVVAPVWMAFRTAIQGTFALIKDGFRTWEEFDRQLVKSKAVIHGYAGTTDQAMKELENTIRSFSKESGIALDDLTSAFYRFGTVGIQFNDALSGAIASAKLAKATFSDVDIIARSLAMTYRLLGDTIDSSLSPMQKQESLAGKIYHLWKTNAFEANEFAQSLNGFISTANIANFTADQTVATLAALGTAGVQGSRGGTLLKTSIQKLVENLDMLAPKLGLAVNPELENTFDIFMRVLGAINELSQTQKGRIQAIEAIGDIFGGTRGAQVISALNALFPELRQNLKDLTEDSSKFAKELNTGTADAINSVSGQLSVLRQLTKDAALTFVQGATGASDFVTALQQLNNAVYDYGVVGGKIGEFFFSLIHPLESAKLSAEKWNQEFIDLENRIRKAVNGAVDLKTIIELIAELETRQIKAPGAYEYTLQLLKEQAKIIQIVDSHREQEAKFLKETEDKEKIISEKEQERLDTLKGLSSELQTKIKLSKEEAKYTDLQKRGIGQSQIAYTKLNDVVQELVDRHNILREKNEELVKPIDVATVRTALLAGNYERVVSLLEKIGIQDKDINNLVKATTDYSKSLVEETDKLVDNELELLRIRGAGGLELLKAESILKSMFFANYDLRKDDELRLKIQKEITKQQNNQLSLSSEAVQLYRIAKKEGISAAIEIGKFLSGKTTFAQLREMPSIFDIFQKNFSQLAETFEAAEFLGLPFKGFGRVGSRVFSAPGAKIPLLGEIDLNEFKREEQRKKQEREKKTEQEQKREVNAKFDVDNINISLQKTEFSKEQKQAILQETLDKISIAIEENKKLRNALETVIEEF